MMQNRGAAGFTLIEALASVALMSFILLLLGVVTGQWLPNWHRGFGRLQTLEMLGVGLRRVVADLEAAEWITANSQSKFPLFIGDAASVTFVRTAIGPDATPHLEFVNLAEIADERGFALVRSRARFTPLAQDTPLAAQLRLVDPVVLVRAPFRISFAFAGADRAWRDTWRNDAVLPTTVRIQVRDAATAQILSVSTATLLHVDLPAECLGQNSVQQCLLGISAPAPPQPDSPTQGR